MGEQDTEFKLAKELAERAEALKPDRDKMEFFLTAQFADYYELLPDSHTAEAVTVFQQVRDLLADFHVQAKKVMEIMK